MTKEGKPIKSKYYLLEKSFIHKNVSQRLEELYKIKNLLEIKIAEAPQGKIHIAKSGNRVQFYLRETSTENTGTYISKRKSKTIKTYLQKSYNEKAFKLVLKEIKVLEKFVRDYGNAEEDLRMLFGQYPDAAKSFIEPMDVSDEEYVRIWQNQPFTPKEILNAPAEYITDRGEHVRSKSELNIANALSKYKIPYKYECPLELKKGLIIYPDFTTLNVRKRKVYYWEHRGMMEDREYARHSIMRIKDYERNGITLGEDLFITEESATVPLGSNDILRVIRNYLLD